jgi:hypothetical protein
MYKFRGNLLGVESLWQVHTERRKDATSLFHMGKCLGGKKKTTTKPQPIFILFVSFGVQALATLLS